ncbi:MAG: TonB-dependent receptor [Emcibacter sp.]|nr:TonB-dependent receptor [Emcibacter sp.]
MTRENMTRENISSYRQLLRRTSGTIVCAALMAGTSSLAYAQQAEEADTDMISSLEEIIVTARKRSENIQETPIAITALSTAQLEKRNLTNLMEVGAYIPNVVMNSSPSTSGGGNNSQIYIRGIGQSDFLFTTDPGVGIYVDGVYHPRTLGGVMDLLDLERVEVLRGPQGTLFGKNTIGGAIALTSQKPMGDGTGYLEVTTGRFDRLDIRGSFDVALSDTLAAKVSMSSKNRDGIGKRLEFGTDKVLDTAGDENATSARIALRWEASEDVTVDFTADYTREREKGVPSILVFVDDNGAAFGGLGGLWNALVGGPAGLPYTSDFIIGGDNRYDSYATDGNRNTLDSYGFSMDIDWAVNENMSLRSITAYREMEAFFNSDTDGSPLSFVTTDQTQDQNQISQEFQLIGTSFDDKLDWVIGAFYFDEFGRDDNVVRLASGLYDALEALPGPLDGSPLGAPTAPGGPGNPINPNLDLDLNIFNEIDIKSYAAFTQGTYQVSDKISITAGARYSYEKKDYFLNHTRENSGAVIIGNRTISESWSSFTPMGSIDYKINEDSLVYVSVTQGFKSGGFNGRPISVSAVDSFDPETVLSYEFGFKTDWFDNRLRLNGAVFNANYTDMQLGSISADENGVLALRIQNAGKAKIQGFELELQARPTANLDIIGSLGYVDFEITQLDPGVQDFNLNSQAMKTPEWNFSLGAEYTVEINSSSEISLRGDWTYQSETEQNVQNTDLIRSPGYSLFNTRLTYSNLDNDWEIALFVTNLTDKAYVSSGFQTLTSFGTANLIYGRPREWGLTVKKRF